MTMRALLAFVLGVSVLGIGGSVRAASFDPALVAAAQAEGEVAWYTSFVETQLARPMADAFGKRFPGVTLRLTTGTVSDLLTRILGEGRAGQLRADVSHAGNAVGPLRRAGLLAPYKSAAAATYPAAYKDPDGFWTAEVVYALAPAVNTSLVAPDDRPKRYEDLLDPRWRGKLPWTNQMAQSGPPAFIALMQAKFGREGADAYFRALAPNIVNLPANQRVVLDQVILGEYPMALMTFAHHVAISARKGAPIAWLPLDPPIQTLDTVFLLRGPHPNAGKLLVEFILSDEGQRVFENAGYTPAHGTPAANAVAGPEPFVLTPEAVDAGLNGWIATFDRFFK